MSAKETVSDNFVCTIPFSLRFLVGLLGSLGKDDGNPDPSPG